MYTAGLMENGTLGCPSLPHSWLHREEFLSLGAPLTA